jgi:hypothetical protein
MRALAVESLAKPGHERPKIRTPGRESMLMYWGRKTGDRSRANEAIKR